MGSTVAMEEMRRRNELQREIEQNLERMRDRNTPPQTD